MRKKDIEQTLCDYKNLDLRIANIDLEIEILKNDVFYATFSYEQKSSPTNVFSSSVENEIIKRDEHLREKIEGLKKSKAKTIALKQKISNSLTSLNEEEYKLIELRYFNTKNKKKTWVEIGMILGIDTTTCHRIKNKILDNLIDCMYISI